MITLCHNASTTITISSRPTHLQKRGSDKFIVVIRRDRNGPARPGDRAELGAGLAGRECVEAVSEDFLPERDALVLVGLVVRLVDVGRVLVHLLAEVGVRRIAQR